MNNWNKKLWLYNCWNRAYDGEVDVWSVLKGQEVYEVLYSLSKIQNNVM